ncbi:MAG: hypothetical protein MJ007_02580 [Paludibacteraceae bacterium]|nr:hypothetical protein [Paludibacteraceae bacterium]
MDKVFKILLAVAAVCLLWMCYDSITTPIKFNDQREIREKKVAARLSDIRKAENEYRIQKGCYAANFDTLMDFLYNEKAKIVLKEGVLTDKQLEEGLTEKEAVKKGIIKRDTTYVSMITAIYGDGYNVDSMRYIPYSNPIQEFELDTATITTGSAGIQVKVMVCKADYKTYLSDLDHQQLVNLIETQTKLEKYTGLKFGDIESANNNAGNWE